MNARKTMDGIQAANMIAEAVLGYDVVLVQEDGTIDAFNAFYVNGKLVVTNPRSDVSDMLDALGVKVRILLVARGFDGNFPPLLNQLETYEP